jgi:hypothetical protein
LSPSDSSLQVELFVETGLQVSEMQHLVDGVPEDYERVGSERVNGGWCDIYESKPVGDEALRLWRRVWINPDSGLPVRVLGMMRTADGVESPMYEYTEIRANEDPPAELFSFQAPAGYEVTEVTETPASPQISALSSGATGNHNVAEWVALKIDDSAILLCWSQWTDEDGNQLWFHDAPKLVLQGVAQRDCSEQPLYETMSGNVRWRWSLIVPKDGRPVAGDSLSLSLSDQKEGTVSLGAQPLEFSDARLAEMVERVQQHSLGADSDFAVVKSLVQLREIIAGRRQ